MKIATMADVKVGDIVAFRACDSSGRGLKDREHLNIIQVTEVRDASMKKHKFIGLSGFCLEESYSFEEVTSDIDDNLSTEPVLILDKVDTDNYAEVDDIKEFTYGAIVAFDSEAQQLVSDSEDCENCVFKIFNVRRQDPDQGLAIVQYVSNDGTDSEDCVLEYNREEEELEVVHVE